MITFRLMAGSTGKTLKALFRRRMRVQDWERKSFATAGYNQRFIYSVFTKDTLDEKGQTRDTSTHVTFNVLNSTKNSPVATA